MNIEQNKRLHLLLNKCKLLPRKAELVESFTDGRTIHSSQMDFREAGELIKYLDQYSKGETAPAPRVVGDANNMRKKILSICHQMQWYKRNADTTLILKDGKPQLDFARIDAYCVKYGEQHKPLQQHTSAELPTLITIFERMKKTTKQHA